MAAAEVSHKGRIVSIDGQKTCVEIISESACAACHAKGLCGMGESAAKTVEVKTFSWQSLSIGQEVNVVLRASMGHKAVWLAYVVPLVVMTAVLLGLLALGAGELAAGLASLAAVAAWYLCIWIFRKRLQNGYVFEIREINQ